MSRLDALSLKIAEIEFNYANYWNDNIQKIPGSSKFPSWSLQITTDVYQKNGDLKCDFYADLGREVFGPDEVNFGEFKDAMFKILPLRNNFLLYVPYHFYEANEPDTAYAYVTRKSDMQKLSPLTPKLNINKLVLDPKPLLHAGKLKWHVRQWPTLLIILVTVPCTAEGDTVSPKSFNSEQGHTFKFICVAQFIYDLDARNGSSLSKKIKKFLSTKKNVATDYVYEDFEFVYFVGYIVALPKYTFKKKGHPDTPICEAWVDILE
jgi:hypothetical protein